MGTEYGLLKLSMNPDTYVFEDKLSILNYDDWDVDEQILLDMEKDGYEIVDDLEVAKENYINIKFNDYLSITNFDKMIEDNDFTILSKKPVGDKDVNYLVKGSLHDFKEFIDGYSAFFFCSLYEEEDFDEVLTKAFAEKK